MRIATRICWETDTVADYHSYIYDTTGRRILGDFEGAYRDCDDVWPTQHDVHTLKYRTVMHIMKSLGPRARLADIGAGYGDFVDVLLREGVDATGYEIAATAVGCSRSPSPNRSRPRPTAVAAIS